MRLGLLTAVVGMAIGIVLARLLSAQRLSWHPGPALRWIPVAGLGAGAVVASVWVDRIGFVALWVVATAAFVSVGLVNNAHRGARLLTAGVLANGLVIIANAGMPVAANAVIAAGGDPGMLAATGRHHLLTDASALPWLADTVGIGWLFAVVSPGDLLLAAGGAVVIATTLLDLVHRQAATARAMDAPAPVSATATTVSTPASTPMFAIDEGVDEAEDSAPPDEQHPT